LARGVAYDAGMASAEQNLQAPQPGVLFTIGHSNHEISTFIALLQAHSIEVVVDVRTYPKSAYSEHFNRAPLERELRDAGIQYLFMGDELGGRPPEDSMYDDEDHVLYSVLAEHPRFLGGLDRLERGIADYRVATMCSEECPDECHRRLLVGKVLTERGVLLRHIRAHGIEDETEVVIPPSAPTLFEPEGTIRWRSVRSVSRSGAPKDSSRH